MPARMPAPRRGTAAIRAMNISAACDSSYCRGIQESPGGARHDFAAISPPIRYFNVDRRLTGIKKIRNHSTQVWLCTAQNSHDRTFPNFLESSSVIAHESFPLARGSACRNTVSCDEDYYIVCVLSTPIAEDRWLTGLA
ncbi:hypothetical protein PUN4_940015 [Paraburkholderia unamae]|nr:hypothetical protein PUN4_940015 [Paraburkholderia unamae]